MPTLIEITEKLQDGVVTAVETSQRWTLDALRATANAFEDTRPDLQRVPLVDRLPSPKEAVDVSFRLAEKLVSAQHDFAAKFADLLAPVRSKSGPDEPTGPKSPTS